MAKFKYVCAAENMCATNIHRKFLPPGLCKTQNIATKHEINSFAKKP